MKKKLGVALCVVIAITAFSHASGIVCRGAIQQEQIAGGYGDTAKDDPEALAAARFAVKKESRKLHTRIALVSIKRAEVQVVAGLNYRLCMTVKMRRQTTEVLVVVYKNLKQKYSLSSWEANGCTQK